MKEEVIEIIKPIIETANNGIIKAVDMLMKESPDIAREIIIFARVQGVVVVLFTLGLVALLCICAKRAKECIDKDLDFDFSYIGSIIFGATSLIAVINLCVESFYLKPFFAPKVYLIEYISKLI